MQDGVSAGGIYKDTSWLNINKKSALRSCRRKAQISALGEKEVLGIFSVVRIFSDHNNQ